ncbi:TolC family protein [bacterium]|nr:TolC family protein [bacterium]
MRMKAVIFLMIMTGGIGRLSSQESMQMLTLEKSMDIALKSNPDLLIAEKEWKKARAGIWEAYSAVLPSVDASANFQHAWDIQTSRIPNFLKPMLGPLAPLIPDLPPMDDYVELSFGMENTVSYGAMLTQPLFLGGAGIAGIKMAHAGARAAEQNLNTRRQNLIYQVADAFYACLLMQELVQVQTDALKQAEKNLDIVRKRYDVGSASGFDKMRAEVEVANLKPELIGARNNHHVALTGLKMILGLSETDRIGLDGELSFEYDEYGLTGLQELQNLAVLNRPEIHALRSQKQITLNGVRLARSQFMPKLFFSTDYSFLDMRNDYKFKQEHFSKGFTSALSLQIPVFHGMKNCKQLQKATLDHKIMQDTEKQVVDGIKAEVENAYHKFEETKEKFQAARESIDMATEAMRLANLTYEEGASTQLDVLSSQLALTRARMNYASALYEYQMARYRIRKVTGALNGLL